MRPGDVEALGPRRRDRRADDVDLLAAQAAVLAGMRIEAGDGKARALQAEIAAKVARRDLDGGEDQVLGQQARHVFQRKVDGDRHHFQRGARQHHHRMRRPSRRRGESGEILGVPGKAKPARIKHGLGDRVGDDGATPRRAGRERTARSIDCVTARAAALVRTPGDDGPRAPRPAAPAAPVGRGRGAAPGSEISPIGTVRPSARARSARTRGVADQDERRNRLAASAPSKREA